MAQVLEVPKILNIPPVMLPFVVEFNNYRYFLLEGGRSSAKTQSIARFVLFLADQIPDLRVVCGREVMNTISESVHAVLSDLVKEYNLAYEVLQNEIRHKRNGSVIKFKGFREAGKTNIKGLEGVDVLWIDEAQSITKPTLQDIVPTIRKGGSKIIFSMNRYMRDDAVYTEFYGRDDCLHIKVNYYDNPYCPVEIKHEAELCRKRNEHEYKNIWLGEPLAGADEYLFNTDSLHRAIEPDWYIPPSPYKQVVVGIDFAAQGNDMCVASILDRVGTRHWNLREQIAWGSDDTTHSVGKIVNILGSVKPDVAALDIGGMGKPVYDRLIELGVDIQAFDGATTKGVPDDYYNKRAYGYFLTKMMFEDNLLILREVDKPILSELEKIKQKYRSDGKKLIEPKLEMKKTLRYSPDRADSLMMAIWALHIFVGNDNMQVAGTLKRKDGAKRYGIF